MPDGLSSKAKQFFSIAEEEEMSKTGGSEQLAMADLVNSGVDETAIQAQDQSFKFTIDSPKVLWDAIGHIQFEFEVQSLVEVEVKLDEVVGFWSAIKEKYADLFNQPEPMTPAQHSYLEKLFGSPLPEGMDKLSKDDASAKIDEELKAQNKAKFRNQQTTNAATKYSYAKKTSSAPRGEGSNQASERTLKFMESIAKRKHIQLPNDYDIMSQDEASAWINENNKNSA